MPRYAAFLDAGIQCHIARLKEVSRTDRVSRAPVQKGRPKESPDGQLKKQLQAQDPSSCGFNQRAKRREFEIQGRPTVRGECQRQSKSKHEAQKEITEGNPW